MAGRRRLKHADARGLGDLRRGCPQPTPLRLAARLERVRLRRQQPSRPRPLPTELGVEVPARRDPERRSLLPSVQADERDGRPGPLGVGGRRTLPLAGRSHRRRQQPGRKRLPHRLARHGTPRCRCNPNFRSWRSGQRCFCEGPLDLANGQLLSYGIHEMVAWLVSLVLLLIRHALI